MLKKVLIVEDSSLQAKIYQMFFNNFPGCQVIVAPNGLQAMDQLALEEGVDLIILDINMPKMNGLDFLEAVRRDSAFDIPIIVISTEGKDDDIRRALELGANAYIKKPWKPDHVREIISKIIPAA
jgi:CheY-like chemotaxis protein